MRKIEKGNFLKRPELPTKKRKELGDHRNGNAHHTMGTREVFHTGVLISP